ncbi:hypothetical protein J3F83DRAFT_728073 [Trichoderma novae-zelandiae]
MESDAVTRYRSRILREMKANRENPFNSPPSSTGRASPTLSSVFSDPEGESTRRLQEDIARVAAPRKLPINWDAARRKWPEFYSQPKQTRPIFDDHTDTTPLAEIPHLNTDRKPAPPVSKYIVDDTTEDAWNGSKRTRAEMQPRVENDPDLSQLASRPPVVRGLSTYGLNYAPPHNPSPLSRIHNQSPPRDEAAERQRPMSVEEALEKLRRASSNPREDNRRVSSHNQSSPNMSSAKSSLTAVPPSPSPMLVSPKHGTPNGRSLLMPDISHLDDFLTGTLKFDGQVKDGVPVLVKHGQVHDQKVQPFGVRYAEVDGIKLPEEEEKIFVSIDMIRDEILSLREQHEKLQEYSATLENEVQRHKSRRSTDGGLNAFNANEQLLAKKNELEAEVTSLQRRLDQAARRISTGHQENDTLTQERDRVISRLQDACEDISKLTRKLNSTEKQLESTHKQLGSTEQVRQDNDTLRRDVTALKQDNAALREEVEKLRREQQNFRQEAQSLRTDGKGLRHDQQSLASENRTLRANNKTLMDENEDLQDNMDGIQHELDAAREENEALRRELQSLKQKQATLREDNAGLVRQNEKYFSENKILRRENAGFEHSVHDLHDRNLKLKEEIEALKRQLDHYRPSGKGELTRQDGETEENMTSAFFVPDITLKSNDDATDTKDMPDDLATGAHEAGRRESRTAQKRDAASEKGDGRHRSRSSVRSSPSKNSGTAQKVAFALPDKAADKSTQGSKSTVANQGSKRRSRLSVPDLDPYGDEDTTGLLSMDNFSQDLAISLNLTTTDHKDGAMGKETKQARSSSGAKSAPKVVHIESRSQPSKKSVLVAETGVRTVRIGERDVCPALSNNARRILDDLCGHNCQNCTVCSRITAHSGVISSTDVAVGKKRVSIPRPVPVSDRGVSGGDHTVRPARSPGYALALVIKGLEDESQHVQLELTRLQARYNKSDKSMGRRERQALSEAIHQLLKRVEAKNDQIYSLYDVLEGQKAAGQEMTDEQVEMTVLNITGMTVRDVTSGSDLTWEGLAEA